ncbi:ImmA/IrrE family metallo-endopeptidase [Hoeflea poritis]|uniref:ImmA/IrrE family metallo-endopeptidase n=1 Tax=Hoeflea poritis TaxID=2993659 RepID=A0ABT4VX84_9HYPH|nr:ImmA/IrrE family metallo-endopeptidase [Hoeflea poritis]MDA4848618.1 ImmA/IrrE family metallo-endopeptidase [Hoeflea poritis]
MRRGFKSQAEKLALKQRADIGLSANDALDPRHFLRSIGIIVWTPTDIPNVDTEHLRQLTVVDPDSWSGITIREGGKTAIIVNATHPITRQANTLMHEWAHIELRHKPSRADRSAGGLLLLSDYPPELEEEADWLAGCILAPRDGLLFHCGKGLEPGEVAQHYGISTQLANWRIGKTGIKHQLNFRQY